MKKEENIFSNLIEENKDKIFRICCYYVANEEDRKDLYQETLLNVWKGYKSFRKESTFSTWSFRIAVNTALAFLSKKRSMQQKSARYSEIVKTQEIEKQKSLKEINLLHKGISQLPLLDMIIISPPMFSLFPGNP